MAKTTSSLRFDGRSTCAHTKKVSSNVQPRPSDRVSHGVPKSSLASLSNSTKIRSPNWMDPWPESRHSIRCKIDECHHNWTCDRPGCSCALVSASHFPYICHRPDPTYTFHRFRMSWPENCCPAQSMPAINRGLVPYDQPANISVSFSVCRDWLACGKRTKQRKKPMIWAHDLELNDIVVSFTISKFVHHSIQWPMFSSL